MARNLLTAFMVCPAFRLRVGALSKAASRMGPSLWAEFCAGGTGEVEAGGAAKPEPAPMPPPVLEMPEVTDQVLWLT